MSETPREEGGQAEEEGAVRVGRGLDFSEEDIAEASAWADSADGRKILRLWLRYRGKLSVGELLTGVGGPRVGFTRSPEDLQARAAEYRDAIVERVAASDDELMEKYLGGEELTDDELQAGIRKLTVNSELYPFLDPLRPFPDPLRLGLDLLDDAGSAGAVEPSEEVVARRRAKAAEIRATLAEKRRVAVKGV